jgi:hypothetical protein
MSSSHMRFVFLAAVLMVALMGVEIADAQRGTEAIVPLRFRFLTRCWPT